MPEQDTVSGSLYPYADQIDVSPTYGDRSVRHTKCSLFRIHLNRWVGRSACQHKYHPETLEYYGPRVQNDSTGDYPSNFFEAAGPRCSRNLVWSGALRL